MPTKRKPEGTSYNISGVSVGTFIAFTLPRLVNGHVYQDNHVGEIVSFEEDRSGTMPKIHFTLKGNDRIFTLRYDYEVRVP